MQLPVNPTLSESRNIIIQKRWGMASEGGNRKKVPEESVDA